MGLDGGTAISRSDVLRGQSWEVASSDDGAARSTRGGQVSTSYVHKRRTLNNEQRTDTAWNSCALSEEPLGSDVVACGLGQLYNREAVLEHLLARRGLYASELAEFQARSHAASAHRDGEHNSTSKGHGGREILTPSPAPLSQLANRIERASMIAHLRSTKDVFSVTLTPASNDPGAIDDSAEAGRPRWICPVTHLPVGGVPFVALRPCGHVVAQRAAKEVGGKACPVCGTDAVGAVPLNAAQDVVDELRAALDKGHEKKEQKKAKKQGKEATAESGGAAASVAPAVAPLALEAGPPVAGAPAAVDAASPEATGARNDGKPSGRSGGPGPLEGRAAAQCGSTFRAEARDGGPRCGGGAAEQAGELSGGGAEEREESAAAKRKQRSAEGSAGELEKSSKGRRTALLAPPPWVGSSTASDKISSGMGGVVGAGR